MKEYSLYLFDFDNTLFDTRKGIEAILSAALPMIGVEYDDKRFDECLGLSMDQVYDRYCPDRSLFERYQKEFMRIVNSDAYLGAEPFPETEHVLRTLRNKGKHIGIVSGKKRFKIENLLKANGMDDIPETIVGFDETPEHKPSPQPIFLGMGHFNIPSEDTIYVGDSPNDALAARNAGLDCAIVDRRGDADIPCGSVRIGSLEEIIAW